MCESVGYTHCACRDCFEITIDGGMCDDCMIADCSGEGECQADGAYGSAYACPGCGLGEVPDTLPEWTDNAAWSAIAGQHGCTCKWVATRGGQLERKAG